MKKNIKYFIILISLLVLTGCTTTTCDNETYDSKDVGTVTDLKKVSTSIPDISLLILGNFGDTVTKDKLQNVQVYQFDAVVSVNEEYYKRTFTGIKLTDFLDELSIDNQYSTTLTFDGYSGIEGEYKFTDIDDSCWLIFAMNNDGIDIDGNTNYLSFAKLDTDSSKWVFGLYDIYVQ